MSKSGRLSSQQPWLGEEPGVPLVQADGGKLQLRGCSFEIDEPSIALRPGLKPAFVTENGGVCWGGAW